MYPKREVYADSPLALVAAEIRFSDSARLRQQETFDAISLAMESEFPVAEVIKRIEVDLDQQSSPSPTAVLVLTNRQRTESVSFQGRSLTFETTDYQEFSRLQSVIGWACEVLVHLNVRPVISRVGLRYIDEIRVPEAIHDNRQWAEWLDPRLIDQLEVESSGYPVLVAQGLTIYDLGDGKRLAFRFSALNQPPVVEPQILHRRRDAGVGPFFVLDFDGFREFGGPGTVPLDSAVVSETLAGVHEPSGALFQSVITDKARKLFRGDTPS